MHKVQFWRLTLAMAAVALGSHPICAQSVEQVTQVEVQEQAQEDLPTPRVRNRSQYYGLHTWMQLDPWITRNQVPSIQPVVRPATAVVSASAGITASLSATHSARYGFDDPSAAATSQGWFYDYYTYSPTYYSASSGAYIYGNASRYYDSNSDGVYESLSNFRDSDKDGSYDLVDRFDFADDYENKDARPEGPTDANRHTINGTVTAKKLARVNGNENIVVQVIDVQVIAGADTNADRPLVIDLGLAQRWMSLSVKEDDQLTATGPIEQIGGKQVLIAETATVGKQRQVTISRSGPRIEGQIIDVTRAEVEGTQHTMVIIQSSSGRQIVDLGPAEQLTHKLEPLMHISVQGVPVQLQSHSVVLASQIDFLNGQRLTIERW